MELQNIIHEYGEQYKQDHKLSYVQSKAFSSIEKCRTSALGGHTEVCEDCGCFKISYNSCRNRNCPKCQTFAKERWIENQKNNLLNVGYFHVVFTIPDTLNPIVYQNQTELYGLLFRAVSETLFELSSDKKYLGATIGFTSVLHTWGQNLMHHPHIHCIVPGGGMNSLGEWVNSRKKFFVPVKVLSRKFKGKFLAYLKQTNLEFYESQEYLKDDFNFKSFINLLYSKEWVVYCKAPFKTASSVVEYLGRYTHRVAISNNRILSATDGNVTFKWRDYKDNNSWKTMTLSAKEFIRRFFIHVLPSRFMKIRHFGLLSNRNKNTRLILCKQLTKTPIIKSEKISTLELLKKITGKDFSKCSHCGSDRLVKLPCPGTSPPYQTQLA